MQGMTWQLVGWNVALVSLLFTAEIAAAPRQEQTAEPVGRYLTLQSPVTDETIGWVRREALALQDIAHRENRPARLILEITPGQSQFHHVYALADFLTSPALSDLRTIAWIPESVTGYNVLLALSCNEILMAPDAELGDMGQGATLQNAQQAIVLDLVGRQRNRKVNAALALAMTDPQTVLLKLTVETPQGERETRLATPSEAEALAESGTLIPESIVLKERGTPGIFSGQRAQAEGILIVRTANTRRDVTDLYNLPVETLREAERPEGVKNVSLIEVHGMVDTVLGSFLTRQISRAVDAQADIILFEIHSPGGNLNDVRDLAVSIAMLSDRGIRTVAWIPEMATGESAIIALGCDEIYVTPQAKFGAVARRRRFEEGNLTEEERDFLLQTMEELAELKGRPQGVLVAMADPDVVVFEARNRITGEVTYMTDEELDQQQDEWIRGPIVPESNEGLLTVSGLRLQQLMVAEPPVAGLDEVLQRIGMAAGAQPKRVEKTWVDDVVFTLNRRVVTGMLFTLAIVCIYLEMHFMSGILGVISVTCFGLFFWSRFLGGTAGGLEIMLFLLGMGCLALEIFVIPGFGVFGISGVLMVLASLVLASQTFGNVESGLDWSQTMGTMKMLSASIVAVIVVTATLSRILPEIPFLRDMILTPPGMKDLDVADQPKLDPKLLSDEEDLVGQRGHAVTTLRPAGKARIGEKLWDVVSEGPFIPEGAQIEVLQKSGNHVVVKEI